MFDVGFLELLVIAALALLVLGPERLPGVIRQVSLWTARSRHFANHLREEFEREANLNEIRESLDKQKQQFDSEVRDLEDRLKLEQDALGHQHKEPIDKADIPESSTQR